MIEQKTKLINGQTYVVQQFAARRGLKLKTQLIKMIAPSIFALAGGVGKGGSINLDSNVDPELLSKAISSLTSNLDSDNVISLIFQLLEATSRNDVQITSQNGAHFDMVYAGNYAELAQALLFVIEVNFGSFFRELGIGKQGQEAPLVASTPSKKS